MEPYQAMELRNEQMVTSGDWGAGLDVKKDDGETESPQISAKKEDEDVQQIVVKSEEEEPIVVEQERQQTVVKDEEGRLIVEEVLEERGQHIAVKKEEDDEQQIAVKEEEEQPIVVEEEEEDRQQIVVKEEEEQSSVVQEGDQEIQQIAVKEEEQPIVVEDDEEDRQHIVVKDEGQLIAIDEEEEQQILVQEEETDHHKWIHIVVKEEERQPIVVVCVEEAEVERQPLQPATMELQSEAGYCDPTDQMQTSDRELVDEVMAASDCSSATVVKEGTEESRQLQTKACLHDQANNFPSTQPPQQTCDSVAGRDQIIQGEGRKTRVSTTIRHQIAEGGVTQTSDHSAGKYQIHDSASERHPITGRKVSRTLAETRLLQTETCVVQDHVYQNTRNTTANRSTSKVRVTRTVDSTPGRSQISAGGDTRTVDSTPVFQTSLSPSLPEADTCLSEEEQTSDEETNHHLGVPSPPQQIQDSASERHPITGRKVSRTLAETRLLQIRTCVMRDHAYQRITPITPCCTGSGNKKKKKTPCCRRDASPRNPCPLCSVVFKHQSALREHLKTHTVAGGKYPCKLCGAVFGVISRLKDHQHTHTGETPYLCETCGQTFKTGEKLQHHRSSHSGFKTYLCQLCGLRFFRPQQLSQHMRKHSSVRDVCGDVLSSPFLLETHMKTRNHCDFLCHVCGKAFRFYKALSTHLRYHELTVKLTDSRNNRHSCRVCGEKFVHFAELLSHKRFSHVEDKPHKCDVCGAAYTSMRSLNKHQKAKKHKIDIFQCLVCGETFSRLRALYSHKQVSHFDKKSYKCSLCEASYLHPRSLRKHKKKQHPNNTCPPVEHEIRPARLPEKPYKCTLCDHAFVLEDHLRRHLLRHSNRPRRFVCEKCGVSYIRKACFLKHMRIHNPIGSQAD
ncbi:uncharacterized protein [Littorina saxatilis]|uniref:uncharacterized protein isoform X2 n=1 Tax=Littorina saxatilis TaxID=31220 RepID=UPI0038B6B0DB